MLHSLLAVSCLNWQLISRPDCQCDGCAATAVTTVGCCAGLSTEIVVYLRTDVSFMQLSRQSRLGYHLLDLAGYS